MTEFAERYINPFTDYGFKKLFGEEPNKDLLLDFLNELLKEEQGQIKNLTYLKTEHLGTSDIDRKAIFDLYCENERGEKFIIKNFPVFYNKTPEETMNVDQFGYSSPHYYSRLPKNWLNHPIYFKLEDFIIEMQIRTLAQHIWAAASRNLQYRKEEDVPREVRREIHSIAAILEEVDSAFENILSKLEL